MTKFPKQQARLAANVKRARLAAKMSQEALAIKAGIHRNYIGKLERGEVNPSFGYIVRIAQALQAKMVVLLDGVG